MHLVSLHLGQDGHLFIFNSYTLQLYKLHWPQWYLCISYFWQNYSERSDDGRSVSLTAALTLLANHSLYSRLVLWYCQSARGEMTYRPVCSPEALPELQCPNPGLLSGKQSKSWWGWAQEQHFIQNEHFFLHVRTSFQAIGSVLKSELVSSTERRFL